MKKCILSYPQLRCGRTKTVLLGWGRGVDFRKREQEMQKPAADMSWECWRDRVAVGLEGRTKEGRGER